MRTFLTGISSIGIAFLIGLMSPIAATAQKAESINVKTLSLGFVSDTRHKEIEERFRDFVRYTARKLSPETEIQSKVVTASTSFELVKLLEQRKVDFFMESAYPTYVINFVHGAGKLLLRRWKGGMAEYYSIIFTRRDSGIKRLEGLKGETIVFEDPGSTSGYLLPKLFLLRQGLKLTEKARFDPNGVVSDITYIFARSQDRLVDLVLTKKTAAGAFSSDDYSALEEKKRTDISILAQTERLPRHLVSVRSDLAPAVVGRLQEVLLKMHEDTEGRTILQKADDTTKFDMLPGGEATMRRRLLESFYSGNNR
jgi:phosphonate transport system substrate-binding protein